MAILVRKLFQDQHLLILSPQERHLASLLADWPICEEPCSGREQLKSRKLQGNLEPSYGYLGLQ